jgi:uncharacterized protein (TIGR02246 family)
MITQEKEIADPQLSQELDALVKEVDEAKNNNDAVAVAALFADDAILVTDSGPIYGREAIEKYHTDLFQKVHFSNHLGKADPNSIRALDTAGNEVWTNGEWSNTIQGKDFVQYNSRAIGQRFRFVRAVLGRIGCKTGT